MAKHIRISKRVQPRMMCRGCYARIPITMDSAELEKFAMDQASVDEIWPNKPESEKNMLKYNLCPDCYAKATQSK